MNKPKPPLELHEYIQVLKDKALWIIIFTLICVIGAAIHAWRIPPVYEAKATLLALKPQVMKINADPDTPGLSMISIKNLLESPELAQELRAKLGWEKKCSVDAIRGSLEARLLIEEDTNLRKTYSPIIELYVRTNNPREAADLANAWGNIFIHRYTLITQTASEQTYQFLQQEYDRLEQILSAKQSELINRKISLMAAKKRQATLRALVSGYMVPSGGTETNLSTGDMVGKIRTQDLINSDNVTNVSSPTDIRVDIPSSTGLMETNHLIGYEGQLKDIELKIKEVTGKATAGDDVKKELAALQARKQGLASKIKEINKEAASLKPEISREEARTAALERDVAALQSKFITITQRKEDAELEREKISYLSDKGTQTSDDIRIASKAIVPDNPIGPRRLPRVLAVGVIALLASVFFVFLLAHIKDNK